MNTNSEINARKKITYLITKSDIGGAQFHTLALIEEFKKDYDVLLISGSAGVLLDQAKKVNVRTKIIPEVNSFNFFFAIFKLRKVMQKEKPDLLHVHSSLASFYGRFSAKMANVKVLYTVHGWHFSHEPSKLKKMIKVGVERFLKGLTNYWITVSNFDYSLGDQYGLFRENSAQAIPNGVKPSQHEYTGIHDLPLSVVFVGRATYQKNCEAAIRVLEYTRSDIHLTMYSSGDSVAALQEQLNKSPAKNKITLVVNEPNAAQRIHNYSVLLMTSRYEGMPLSVLEAMREGLTIISTDVCGMNEVVINGENGYLLPENSEQRMAKVLDDLASNLDKLSAMGECSKTLFHENFSLRKMLDANRDVYRKII